MPVAETATAELQDSAAPVLPPMPTALADALPVLPVVAEPTPAAVAPPDAPPVAVWVTMPEPPEVAPIAMEPPNRVSPLDASTSPESPEFPDTCAQPPSPV